MATTFTHRAFGVEQEHFVFRNDGTVPDHSDIDLLWIRMGSYGFHATTVGSDDRVLSIGRKTEWGLLSLTNDACTHIVEAVFPKISDLGAFRTLYAEVWEMLAYELDKLGLHIRYGGALLNAPAKIHWRAKDSGQHADRLFRFIDREPTSNPLFHQAFPACFAATQVSLDIPQEQAIRRLAKYYHYEYLVPLSFSNSFEFQGTRAQCIRALAYVANFHSSYVLLGIPKPIPKSLDEYRTLQMSMPRDYSYVAIRSESRVEFRSACSQNTVHDVIRLVRFRLAVDKAIAEAADSHFPQSDCAQLFHNACYGEWPADADRPPLIEELLSTLQEAPS